MSLSVILPCLNEEANVSALVVRLEKALNGLGIPYELLLIDDGSTDGTWSKIEQMQNESSGRSVRGIQHLRNKGIFESWKTGVAASEMDFVCFMDSDLQNPPEALPMLWRSLQSSRCDIVQGVRSSIEWDRDGRYWSSRGLNVLLNLVFGDRASDNKSGFVLAPRLVMSDILEFRKSYRYPQTFIRVAARSKGYTVEEVETLFLPRRAGQSFLANRRSWAVYGSVLVDMARAVGEFSRGLRHPADSTAVPHEVSSIKAKVPYSGLRRLRFETYFATMPLHAWLIRRSTRGIYLELQHTQWLDRQTLQQLQERKLRRIVQHAYAHVPYYRRVMEREGIRPAEVQTLDDLRRLPLLGKDAVREHLYFDLFSDTHRKRDMHKIATSGSTGQPFVIYADRQQLEVRFATTLRSLEWTGWRFGDRQVRLWHQTLGMSRLQAIRERLDAWLLKRKFVPAFELNDEGLDRLGRLLNRYRPVLIDGYAESLNFLALYLRQRDERRLKPRAVMSSAQVLTRNVRERIEQELECKVFDKYGAREFSGIAYQCAVSSDHHVMDESYIVELLTDGRPSKPGEVGEVVITDLNNFSTPLIRYRIGDLAVATDPDKACTCGRKLSRIGEIQGRTQALVHCSNGRWLPGTFFAHFFKDYEHLVTFFQIRQDTAGEFDLLVVAGPQWSESEWTALIKDLREYVGDTRISVQFVQEIPLLATGKRSPVISNVQIDFQSIRER